ncbi:MAG: hypothetical protein EZS28_039522 [Streblomastix strix]|uniref:Uncharacterized protein n=1 Tax=Streblomastix strix TaxID=222440 RepID=A0A5J4U4N8_9EUKA|nr:MAG: hypothetical protein EZS28_039522 [Streblomastix strix]
MPKAITGRASVQVYHTQQIGKSLNNQKKNMFQRMTQRHYNQPKQQDRNLEFDSEDIEIDLFHLVERDQGTTFLTEEMNRENDQDQEGIRDRETIKV